MKASYTEHITLPPTVQPLDGDPALAGPASAMQIAYLKALGHRGEAQQLIEALGAAREGAR